MTTNGFGKFERHGRAYRIDTPDTPMPWVNVVSNGHYGFVVSQRGGGFAWLDDCQMNVLSRWDMDLIQDEKGRFLYCRDLESGALWSLAPNPCRAQYDSYACTHEPGVTTFDTRAHGIEASWSMAVDPTDPVEVWSVRLRNTTDRARTLRIASYFEWTCGRAPDVKREFHKLFITTEHDAAAHTIYATKNMWEIPDRTPADHWNRPWPYIAAHALVGSAFTARFATADKAGFLGRGRLPMDPAFLAHDKPVGRFGRFVDSCACLGGDLTLAPGAETTVSFLTAITPKREALDALLKAYRDPARAAAVAEAARSAWATRLAATTVATDLPAFDATVNTWLPYQAISGRLWGRTGYYQQSGAFGFRDQLQDSQVWLPIDPAQMRARILDHATQQFTDGRVHHWWHALANFGNQTACSDDYLWLPFIVASYIRDTNDTSILDQRVSYLDDAHGGTILDHCRRSLRRGFSRISPRGLPHIGSCDWNDGLSAVGLAEKGESVWLSFFMAELCREFAMVLDGAGEPDEATTLRGKREELLAAANAHAWDGQWFRRATLDSGEWLGTSASAEGQIYLNPQVWAILTDGAPDDRLESAWSAVRDRLIQDMGPLLLVPAYSVPDTRIGYITRYSPGSRENGGVYTHAAVWALAAAAKRKDINALERIYRGICPPAASGRDAELYAAEPYVTPGNIDGPLADTPGRAGWTWYTGSAAWLHRVSLEWIAGIRPVWGGVRVDPCPVPGMGSVRVERAWRGRRIVVEFDAAAFDPEAAATVTVNGRAVPDGIVREDAAPVGGVIHVRVAWALPVRTRAIAAHPAAKGSVS
jgi:cellobiose phosphorylase